MNNNKFIPPQSPQVLSTCEDEYCEPSNIAGIERLCDVYTFGPFTAPTTLYTHFNYNRVRSNDECCAKLDGRAKTLCEEFVNPLLIKYKIYQIIDSVEHYVGEWVIKDKETPNLKKLEICGEYILRYCSEIPNVCLECFTHQLVPEILESCKTSTVDYEKVCLKNITEDVPVLVAWARHCSDCSDTELSISYFSQDGLIEYDKDDYVVVDCKTREVCFLQSNGMIIKRIDSDGIFTYVYPDNSISTTPPINFSSSEEVLCPTPYALEHEFYII